MGLDQFLVDLEAMRVDLAGAPRSNVLVRFRRRIVDRIAAADVLHSCAPVDELLDRTELTLFLYRADAPPRSRPFVAVPVAPTVHIEELVPDASAAVAIGWPVVGRAVAVQAGAHIVWPDGPGTSLQLAPRLE